MVWNVFKRPRPSRESQGYDDIVPRKNLTTDAGLPVIPVDGTPNVDVSPTADAAPSVAVPASPVGTEAYPYSLPSPPKSWLFGGLGYGYGIGCSVGPVFGLGVGMSPGGVQFGAGVLPVGVFCGVGLAAGAIVGQGSAYVPYGFTSGFFLAPRFVMLEGMADIYRERMAKRRTASDAKCMARRHETKGPMWPKALQNRVQKWLQVRNPKHIPDIPSSSDQPQEDGKADVTLPPSFVPPCNFLQADSACILLDSQTLKSR